MRRLGIPTAMALVIANMIGSGIYTSLGFQLANMQSLFAVLMLWVVGGIIAVCGALVYGELGAALPNNGGEYNFLKEIYSPFVGFLAGWVSSFVGFAAPVAAVSIALGNYLNIVFPALPPLATGLCILAIITALHAWHVVLGSKFQQVATLANIAIIVFLIVSGFTAHTSQPISVAPTKEGFKEIFNNPYFVVNLYWVSYAYTGWNAASYIAGEIRNPAKNLPIALIAGTGIVTILYVLLNWSFLNVAPASSMKNQLEVGFVAAQFMFGATGSKLMGIIISISLLSTISAMTFAGPRVSACLKEEVPALNWLGKLNKNGSPAIAIYVQSAIAALLVLLNQFQLVIDLIGFTLALSTSLTVFAVFKLRKKYPAVKGRYQTWGYPFTPIIFLLINAWILYYGFMLKPWVSLAGLSLIAAGAIVYMLGKKSTVKNTGSIQD
ncbi:MAG: APC family permease [Ferruginibacter sp.]